MCSFVESCSVRCYGAFYHSSYRHRASFFSCTDELHSAIVPKFCGRAGHMLRSRYDDCCDILCLNSPRRTTRPRPPSDIGSLTHIRHYATTALEVYAPLSWEHSDVSYSGGGIIV